LTIARKLECALKEPDSYVLYFKNPDYIIRNPKALPHYHIIIPINSEEFLLMVMMTSKVDAVKNRYTDERFLNCLVEIETNTTDINTKHTIIDCNECMYITKDRILSNTTLQFYRAREPISKDILKQIKNAIKNSPKVKQSIKKKIL
jgi:hypothetical protein